MNTLFCDPRKNSFFENAPALASSSELTRLLRNTRKTIYASSRSTKKFKTAQASQLSDSSKTELSQGRQSGKRRRFGAIHPASSRDPHSIPAFYTDSRSHRIKRREFWTSNEAAKATLQPPELWTNQRGTSATCRTTSSTCLTTSGPGHATSSFLGPKATI